MSRQPYALHQRLLAWSVHIFTATGMLAGFAAIIAITRSDWRSAGIWLLVGLVIDGVDGTFARLWKVSEVLPHVQGKMIDYVIDFANYAIIPAFFIYQSGLIEDPLLNAIAVGSILLVSAIYYGMDGMVSDDFFFVGFPVLWNLVMFYLFFVFDWPEWLNFSCILFLAVLHFVPIKFMYPSQATKWRMMHVLVSALTMFSLSLLILNYPAPSPLLFWLATFGAIYFFFMAVYFTWIRPISK
jgi:phosphatidylcholine synthase